jgi:hypothetical protein
MEKGFKNIALFFAVTAAIVLIGFFPPTYPIFHILKVLSPYTISMVLLWHCGWWFSLFSPS